MLSSFKASLVFSFLKATNIENIKSWTCIKYDKRFVCTRGLDD